jgi:hypothetical protein
LPLRVTGRNMLSIRRAGNDRLARAHAIE